MPSCIRQHGAASGAEVHPHRKTLLLVNPAAGGGRARRAAPAVAGLLRKHGVSLELAESQSAADIRARAAQAAADGFRVVAVLGGDGALHHAVNGAFGTGVDFAIFPAGNGNDAARGLGLPLDPLAAAHAFLRGRPHPTDLLHARFASGEARYIVSAGGLGLDGEAARLATTRFHRLPGAARYVAAALWVLAGFQPAEMEIEWDDGRWRGPLLLAAVANGSSYGAGLRIEPAARMDDGLLNIVLAEPMPLLRVLGAFPILLRDGNLNWPEIRRLRSRRVLLRPLGRLSCFHADGEFPGDAPVEITVAPAAARFIF
jgi:diacylglycerol kinase (ATP)